MYVSNKVWYPALNCPPSTWKQLWPFTTNFFYMGKVEKYYYYYFLLLLVDGESGTHDSDTHG